MDHRGDMESQAGLNWTFMRRGGRLIGTGRDPDDVTNEMRFFGEVPVLYGTAPEGFRVFYLLNGFAPGWQDAIRQILPNTIFEADKRTFCVSDTDYALMRIKADYQ